MTPEDITAIQEAATWCLRSFHKPESPWVMDWMPSCLVGAPEQERLARLLSCDWQEALAQVARSRREAIADLPKPLLSREPAGLTEFRYCLLGGRFYQVFLQQTPRDSDCEQANEVSRGFFDRSGLPAWDTWVMLSESSTSGEVLIGWVPNSLTLPVGDGMYWFKNSFAEWIPFSEVVKT